MCKDRVKCITMKCNKCGHEEEVPQFMLDQLAMFSDDKTYQMVCPKCEDTMFEKGRMN